MLHQKFTPIEGHKNSTQKDEYEFLYKKDDELEHENESVVKNGNDFLNCKIIHDRDST